MTIVPPPAPGPRRAAAAGRGRTAGTRAGTTLLQLALTLVTLTAIASLAIPGWFARDQITLDNAAILLARDLREVQNRAAFQRRSLDVCFLPDGEGYEVRDDAGQPARAIVGTGPFRRLYPHDAVFRGVEITSIEPDRDALHYTARGLLAAGATIELRYAGATRTILVETESGRIAVTGLERLTWIDDGR